MNKFLLKVGGLLISSPVISQADIQAPCAASNEGKAGDITISYTIAEMTVVDTWKYSNLMITQGVLQPSKENVNGSADQFTKDEIKLFPNPTPDIITVQFGSLSPGRLSISLFDNTGKLLQQDAFGYTGFITRQLDLSRYVNATYLLKVIFIPNTGKQKQGSYGIIKINR